MEMQHLESYGDIYHMNIVCSVFTECYSVIVLLKHPRATSFTFPAVKFAVNCTFVLIFTTQKQIMGRYFIYMLQNVRCHCH